MDPISILVVALLLAGAGAAGWYAGSRSAAAARGQLEEALRDRDTARAEGEGWREKFNAAIRDLAAERKTAERVETMEAELRTERASASTLAAQVAAFERGEAERQRAHEVQLAQLTELSGKLEARFGELAGKAVEGAHDLFLKRADARFNQAGEKHEEKIKALLNPVRETLARYESGVEKVEKERREAYGNLTGLIDGMRIGQEAVRSEAAKLVNSLRSAPKSRGRWGEQQLKNVLETCGLSEHCDFQTEVSVSTEDGRLRPDVIVRVPGGRALVIDAKVSLNAYQDAFGAVDEAERAIGLAAHCAAMKAHVNSLGNKAYWAQFAHATDYVIMFVPGEHFLSAALEHDPTLWDFAFEKKVLLATPTNLIAIARTVSAVWRQEKLAAEAQQIGALGKEMHDRLAVAASKLKTVGSGLNTAVKNYNEFVSSFESRVMVTGRKFRDLNIEPGTRELDELPHVDSLARYGESAALAGPGPEAEIQDEAAE